MTLIYIHGSGATKESFTHIREHVGGDDLCLEYDSNDGFNNNLKRMKRQLDAVDTMFFIAHSLGGIYALHLANHYAGRVQGAVTMSTPYGGSKQATYASYFLPFNRLMREIGPLCAPIVRSKRFKLPCPWTQIVTTRGKSLWIIEPNDGVVTIESQQVRPDMELIKLNLNHYEVVIANVTCDIIKARLG